MFHVTAIDKILNGEDVDLSDAVFVYELEPGEGAENGIAASKEGAVILTNQKCYLLKADNGVKKVWETSYKSVGAKESKEGDETTGGGLAWGRWMFPVSDQRSGYVYRQSGSGKSYCGGYENRRTGCEYACYR